MIETTIRLNGESNVERSLKWFRQTCLASGMTMTRADEAVDSLEEPIRALIERGQAAADAGQPFRATETVNAAGFRVTLVAEFGRKRGILARLAGAFSGRRR